MTEEIKDTDYYESETNGVILSGAILNQFHRKGSGGEPENMKSFFKHNNESLNMKLRKLKDPEKAALGLSGDANSTDSEIIKIPNGLKSWTNKQCGDFLHENELISSIERLEMNQGSHKGAIKRLEKMITNYNTRVQDNENLNLSDLGLPEDFFAIKRKDMPKFITNELAAPINDIGIESIDKLSVMREKIIAYQRKVHGV